MTTGDRDEHVIVWVDGTLSAVADARVSPLDHGLLTGDGVFETLRVYRGVPFAWTRHYQRLCTSAAGLGLAVPASEDLRRASDAVIDANGLAEARLRVTITGGEAPLGSERGDAPPSVIVVAGPFRAWSPTVDVVSVPWPRNERGATAGIKTISYAENVRALAYAHQKEAGEAIFANTRGELCEATGSNVFLARDGVLHTPPAESGCLLGVTRALLLEICRASDVPSREAAMDLDALRNADEAFLSSTTREVHPIVKVDGKALPSAPGPLTAQLADRFTALVARDLDP